jgi:putative N6-adenine-specific DNA methylase
VKREAAKRFDAFAIAAPGLEAIVAKELADLGHVDVYAIEGGVEFKPSRRQLYEANLHLRTASRVVIRLGHFRALTFAELEKRARQIPWDLVIGSKQHVALRVTCRKSKLYHSGAVAERIGGAVVEQCQAVVSSRSADEDDPGESQLIVVRFDNNHCTVSADSSGTLLHMRGYRQSVSAAPLRETLAAALILASEWDRQSPLIDPFCGSGTIPIEAALIAGRIAPGKHRRFRFMDWPGFNVSEWKGALSAAARQESNSIPAIRGSDRMALPIRASTENAERAGVASHIVFERGEATRISPDSPPGWIVSNPPYGVRLGNSDELRRMINQFAGRLREEFAGWRLGLLVPGDFTSLPGLDLKSVIKTTNGGLRVRMVVGAVRGDDNEAASGAGGHSVN